MLDIRANVATAIGLWLLKLGWNRWAAVFLRLKTAQLVPYRAVLNSAFPIERALDPKAANEIYGYWLTGQLWGEQDSGLLDRKPLKRVILCHPSVVDAWFKGSGQTHPNQETLVRSTTDKLRRAGTLVMWHKPFLGIALTFYNPERDDAWLLLEPTLPQQNTAARPSFHIRKKDSPAAYKSFWDAFDTLWNGPTVDEPGPTR